MSRWPGRALLGTALLLLAGVAAAKEVSHDVNSVPDTDFRTLRTFSIGDGEASSRFFEPEIDNRLFLQRMRRSIRAVLVAKGLKESSDHPDLAVTFHVTDADYATVQRREPVRIPGTVGPVIIPGGPEPSLFIAGTLVIDFTDASGKLVWRGTWHERESSGPRLSRQLSENARKLLSGYPPKRK